MPDLSHSFGKQRVDPQQRRQLVRSVFARVAPRYDLMNDLMSLGVHRYWKRVLARQARAQPAADILDLAGGTGDVARLLLGHGPRVLVCDPSLEMMQVGRARDATPIHWLAGSAEALPLPDASIDLVTIAFGIRNVTRIEDALTEMHRVLRPGGRLLCLEFSRPAAWLRPFYDAYSRLVIPRLGAWVSGNPDAYHYLIDSIRVFPDQRELCALFEQAGFGSVAYRNLSFGIACIHSGTRPPADDG